MYGEKFISINEKTTKYLLKGATKNIGWPRLSSLHCNNVSTHVVVHATWSHFFCFIDAMFCKYLFYLQKKELEDDIRRTTYDA